MPIGESSILSLDSHGHGRHHQHRNISQQGQSGDEGEPKGMSTAVMRGGLLEVMKSAGIKKWDSIAFDTCLIGGIEVIGDFADLTNIFIACPEMDYEDGWNYGPVLQ